MEEKQQLKKLWDCNKVFQGPKKQRKSVSDILKERHLDPKKPHFLAGTFWLWCED